MAERKSDRARVNGNAVWTAARSQLHKPPTTWFVNSMGDLFHEDVPEDTIDHVFAVMALCPQDTFQVLTKRAERMRSYCSGRKVFRDVNPLEDRVSAVAAAAGHMMADGDNAHDYVLGRDWPFSNVWLGVSAEDQTRADERVPPLLQTPAAVRFVSAEPLLGPIDLTQIAAPNDNEEGWKFNALTEGDVYYQKIERVLDPPVWEGGDGPYREHKLDWVIVGGELGLGARPVHPRWVRDIRDQCAAAGVAFFFKQWGEWLPGEANRGQFAPTPMHAYRRCDNHSFDWPEHARHVQNFGTHPDPWSGDLTARRIGKIAAGRLLDGIEHNAMPSQVRP